MKIVSEDSKKGEEKFVCNCEINKRKLYYNKIVHKLRTKSLPNNISKTQIYNKIKFNKMKLFFLLNIIISFINHFFPFVQCESNKPLFKSFVITLTIKEKGYIKILSDDFLQKYNHLKII